MSEWKKVKIGDVCRIEKGTTGIASAETGEYPLVVTAEERKTCSTYQFDCEAVCIPLVSSSGHGKKSLNNVHYQSGKFALGTILCAVIPNNSDELDARFLHQYLQFYKDTVLVPLMKGAANVSLSMKDIATVEFPLPPIEKQRELSTLFVTLQENQKKLVAETEKQFEYAKLLRQNILQDAIEGKLTADWRKNHPVIKGDPNYDAEALFEKIQEEKTDKKQKKLPPITAEEKPFDIPEGWKWVKIEQISISVGNRNNQILSKDVKDTGKYPAVSQGQKLIDGYSDDESKVIDDLPLIMFGDHTRNVKFIDFPFVINADGTKFFKMILGTPKYLYYAVLLLSLKIRNRGYARHYSLLKETPFPLSPLAEQKEIVTKTETLLAKVTELENQIQERENMAKLILYSITKKFFDF